MIDEIMKIIKLQEKVNPDIHNKKNDFDKEDIIETYNDLKFDLDKLIKKLEKCELNEKDNLKKIFVHIELNFANLGWVVDEVRKNIRNTIIKL